MNTAKEGKSSKLIVKSKNPASGQHDLARFMSIKFSVSCDLPLSLLGKLGDQGQGFLRLKSTLTLIPPPITEIGTFKRLEVMTSDLGGTLPRYPYICSKITQQGNHSVLIFSPKLYVLASNVVAGGYVYLFSYANNSCVLR